ncbi:SRPBCC family protein [Solimonas soli]|uniref:SRPBCC family protein n=1 Tax=Solimonas soli TaxID=413479 RepID=UPI0004BA2E4A|nr:SRPBCC family protein [Solimonas soli]
MRRAALLLLCGLAVAPVRAATVDALEVTHEDARYRIELRARLDVPAADAYAVFRDFRNLPRINDAVEDVEAQAPAAAGGERWRTTVRVCISFFCTRLHQVQDVRDAADAQGWRLDATVIPALSNLRYGLAAWRLDRCDAQTCLWFQAELEPDFWVPPLLGPWMIERTMRRQAQATAQGIERLARERGQGTLSP